jgi:protease-4
MMKHRGKIILAIFLGSALVVGVFAILLVGSIFSKSTPTVLNNSILELKLEGSMPESVSDDPFLKLFAGQQTSLKSTLENIQKAKVDKNIKGILLLINDAGLGQGRIQDIRDAIGDFKQSGKPVYAYMEQGGDREYALAISADKIYVAPAGSLLVRGFAAHATFMRGFFDKIKVEPNFARHGKYKSAVERYTRSEMSPEDKEAINELLDDIYDDYVQNIAKARKKDAEEVKKLIDEGPYNMPKQAKEVGLIDDAIYLDEVKERIKEDLKLTTYTAISSNKYNNVTPTELKSSAGSKIAIIYASGPIISGKSNSSPFSDETIGSDTVAAAIKSAREDSTIKAIILRVNSPGGSPLASDIIWREIILTKKAKKPIIACMSDVAASGGYYISMGADKIVAQPSTITGSIGIFGGKFNVNGLYKDYLGMNTEAITRGKNADFYSEYKNYSEEELAKLQKYMDEFYVDFTSKAAEGRNMKVEAIDNVGQGRVWSGIRGKEIGLVDELGGLQKSILIAKDLAKLPENSVPELVEFPKVSGFAAMLADLEEGAAITQSAKESQLRRAIENEMPTEMKETFRALSIMKTMEKEHVFALMPYQISIR